MIAFSRLEVWVLFSWARAKRFVFAGIKTQYWYSTGKARDWPVLGRDSRTRGEEGTTDVPFSPKAPFRLVSLVVMYNVAPRGGCK